MWAVLMLSSACVAAASCTSNSCADLDVSSLLQAGSLVRKSKVKQHRSADALLQSVQDVANSFRKGSAISKTPEEVNVAVGAASDALATMFPLFAEQHSHAQNEVHRQLAEVEACHDSSVHGVAAVAGHAETLSNRLVAKDQCVESLATSSERQTQECDGWTNHASQFFNDLPGCGQPSTPEEVFEIGHRWVNWQAENWEGIVEQRTQCNEATTEATAQTELCTAISVQYDNSFCTHSLMCNMLTACHAHEVDVYNSLIADIEEDVFSRQSQYRTARQADCILHLITTAMLTATPIDDDSLRGCDDVSVEDLVIVFPNPPGSPECPEPAEDVPQCPEFQPEVHGWENGQPVVIPCSNGRSWESTNNVVMDGTTFTKPAGHSAYDASAVIPRVSAITISAGQANHHVRMGLTSDSSDESSYVNGRYVGLFPGGRMYLPPFADNTYTVNDRITMQLVAGSILLLKNNVLLARWDHTGHATTLFAKLHLYERGSSIRDVCMHAPQKWVSYLVGQDSSQGGERLAKMSGHSNYDAYAVIPESSTITVNAGQQNNHVRVGLTSDFSDDSVYPNGRYVGLFPGGRMYLPPFADSTYTVTDDITMALEGGRLVLRKNDNVVATWAEHVDSTTPLFAKLWFYDRGSSMIVHEE